MNTVWVVAATVSALPLGGVTRAWIVRYGVTHGHRPRSACPNCMTALAHVARFPTLGWLPPNGRCRRCRSRVGPPPAVVETAMIGAAAALTYTSAISAATPAYLVLAAAGVTLAFIDLAVHRLPDQFTLLAFGAAVAITCLHVGDSGSSQQGLRAAAAAGITTVVYLALAMLAGAGLGDAKLGFITGLLLGTHNWLAVFIGGLLGFLLTACTAVTLLAAGSRSRSDDIAHGPSMLAATLITLAASNLF
jgi:leader peptidase (prepilin peptidase) / N-methyltransferase